jgi:hypothetical protein
VKPWQQGKPTLPQRGEQHIGAEHSVASSVHTDGNWLLHTLPGAAEVKQHQVSEVPQG